MQLEHRFDYVTGHICLDNLEIVSVARMKHASVDLCIKSNMNIPFAKIKLYSADRFVNATTCFESAKVLGEEIERRWQLQAELERLKDYLKDHFIETCPDIYCGKRNEREQCKKCAEKWVQDIVRKP